MLRYYYNPLRIRYYDFVPFHHLEVIFFIDYLFKNFYPRAISAGSLTRVSCVVITKRKGANQHSGCIRGCEIERFFSKMEFENLLELEKYDSVLKLNEMQQFKFGIGED